MTAERLDSASGARAIALRGWPLFWILAALVSVVEVIGWYVIDWTSSADIQSLIGFNWRLSTPYFLLTFCASSLQRIVPSDFSRWLLANRRYTGLAFSVVAGWQLATIGMLGGLFPADLLGFHTDSFQFLEDSIFATIVLMTVTSFRAVKRHISLTAWRRIHTTGIYLLASLFSANYLYEVDTRDDSASKIVALAFALAWSLRAAVWWRQRSALHGWTLFWALSATTGFAVMVTWDIIGFQSDDGLHLISRLLIGAASVALLTSFCSVPLRRLFFNRVSQWLFANRIHFFLVFAVNFALYMAFLSVRLWEAPSPDPLLFPLPTFVAVCISAIGVSLLFTLTFAAAHVWRARIVANSLEFIRAVGMLLLAGLLTYGFLVVRSEALSALILVGFALAWLLQVAALLRPGAARQLTDHW